MKQMQDADILDRLNNHPIDMRDEELRELLRDCYKEIKILRERNA